MMSTWRTGTNKITPSDLSDANNQKDELINAKPDSDIKNPIPLSAENDLVGLLETKNTKK